VARLQERDYTYFRTVRGMCRHCREIVPAHVFFRDGQVWQQSLCPSCRNEPALIASDYRWYLAQVLRAIPDHSPLPGAKPLRLGCPHDCGPCAWHASPCQLPVISVTNACDLRCPICFTYNRTQPIYHMSVEEMRRRVDCIIAASGTVDLINITGGEPTLHPQLLDILKQCQRPQIGRITMNSNGLRLARDYDLCEELARLGVYIVLSLDTLDGGISEHLHGRDITESKHRAIENLTRAGVRMTLLHVMIRDTNEDCIRNILELLRQNDQILSLTVQTMTYTGQGGGRFTPRRHIPVDEAAHIVCAQSGGELAFDDFVTRPSAHPLCYLICYMLKRGPSLLPFARFAAREQIERLLRESYLMRAEDAGAFFADAINQLYAQGRTEHLAALRELVETLYPTPGTLTNFERQRLAETSVRTVYVHTHMDEDTFDCSRALLCPDLVPGEPDRLVPACTYNLFYRRMDGRFYAE
jgi:uncharacterized radical SAM superfamily Fe-S cluster-containing enzyme